MKSLQQQTFHNSKPHHWLLRSARIVSGVFRPVYFPVVGVALLFQFTFLSIFPMWMQLMVLGLVAMGTLVLPRLTIRLWRKLNGLELHMLRHRQMRFFPYIVHLVFYAITLYYIERIHLLPYVAGIIIGAMLIQAACTLVNLFWKVSSHCAGAGGITGALIAYSLVLHFDAIWWLCLSVILQGVVGSSRMLLRQHTLAQVVGGALIGLVCGFLGFLIS
ncbi:MAG: phosphatase PAP2 family protein [Bacteroidaceae bacterium]|nr:phosphatase PAP2 family protein [Bacteroidaceae bacterium]